jgi:hypothetical protein
MRTTRASTRARRRGSRFPATRGSTRLGLAPRARPR